MKETNENKDLIEDSIVISPARKMGFVKNPDPEAEDIEIREENLKHAIHGDIVKVEVLDKVIDNRVQGKVLEIVKRSKTKYVGIIQKKGNNCFLLPDSKKMYTDIYLSGRECDNANDGDKAFVEIVKWDDNRPAPEGKILEVLGPKGNHEVEIRSIILEKGIETDFPPKVQNEAKDWLSKWPKIIKDEAKNPDRRDFRNITTFTIDPADAKDFDDALSVQKLDNGNYEIGIHIADVSYFVRPGTKLDEEAKDRAFSVYLVDRTIPMLPEILSNDLCSLNPNEDRMAFSAVFEMTSDAKVISEWFGRTIINSDRRFSYEEAQEILDDGKGDYYEELNTLNEISLILTKNKLAEGAIQFEKEEFKFELDDNKVPIKIYKKPNLRTHKLIEEYMLLANRHVAQFIFKTCKSDNGGQECGLMYRVHDVPNKDKIEQLRTFVNALGYTLNVAKDGSVTAQDLNSLLMQVSGKSEESLISTAAIRTMSKAMYSTSNSGHFGLAFEYYTHFTSPIRRYPDLIVHRILDSLLRKNKIDAKLSAEFSQIANHSSEQESSAQDAERSSIRFKQIEFMQNHVGEEFTGIISGVAQFGIFVVLDDTGAEGLIHISKLGEDYWNLDEKNYRLVGERTHKTYRLGDTIKVKIEKVNLDDKKMDMVVVE